MWRSIVFWDLGIRPRFSSLSHLSTPNILFVYYLKIVGLAIMQRQTGIEFEGHFSFRQLVQAYIRRPCFSNPLKQPLKFCLICFILCNMWNTMLLDCWLFLFLAWYIRFFLKRGFSVQLCLSQNSVDQAAFNLKSSKRHGECLPLPSRCQDSCLSHCPS